MNEAKDTYFVAVKVLLRKGDSLLLTHDIFGDWDIPGGRIKPDEFETPIEGIITRKMREELGEEVKYSLGNPKTTFRHKRTKHSSGQEARIFALGYEAIYKSGEIKLGANHDSYEWVNLHDVEPSHYLKGGWLKGIVEYIEKETENKQ